MRGWFKLIETIRKTDSPSTSSNELIKSSTNSNTTTATNTNGHVLNSPGIINLDNIASESPNFICSPTPISLVSTPVQSLDDTSLINIESTTKTKDSKRSTIRRKKITIRKSTRSKEFSTINNNNNNNNNNNASNDDIINLDIHQRKRQSNDSIIPLATDLESLPGHNQDESRDKRFLDYTDFNTLSLHFNTCLYIDKKSFSSSYLTKQHIFKTRHNVLNKIFKLYYIKTYENDVKIDQNIFIDKNQETKSNSSLSTSISFQTDWSVNRRNSSSYRREPKNMFHILQLSPKKDLSLSTNNKSTTKLSIEHQQYIDYEHIKDLLVRTYYPHFHTAVQSGHYFGSKSKLPIKHDLPIFTNPESPIDTNETIAITLKSPPSTTEPEFKTRGRKPKYKKLKDKPLPITSVERRVSEEIPPVVIKESMIVLTPTEIPSLPIVENEMDNNTNNNRKRKISTTINSNINDRQKRKFVPSPSPEFNNEYQDIAHSDR
ncbi:unnamed protein product [Rotaria sp. Silwood2]|nr:unnamed protein product [Rotaria sp. Silwood2]